MHTSLDGFVAGPTGEIDWIIVHEEMFDLAGNQTDQADTALYGRVTYQLMERYWPGAGKKVNATKHDLEHSAWYNRVEKVILSRTMKGEKLKNTRIIGDHAVDEVIALKERPGKNILIFGSPGASHALMAADLIDDYWLLVNPILLGKGTPLFKEIREKKKLRLVSGKVLASGVVCLHYQKVQD